MILGLSFWLIGDWDPKVEPRIPLFYDEKNCPSSLGGYRKLINFGRFREGNSPVGNELVTHRSSANFCWL